MIPKVRPLRIASAISRALSQIFYDDFACTILISDVRVSKDLKYSDIFLYKDNSIDLKELGRIAGFLQHKLTKYISVRYLPKLRFHLTDGELLLDQTLLVNLQNDESNK